jgi:uncharacterized protein YkwD
MARHLKHLPKNSIIRNTIEQARQNFWKVIRQAQRSSFVTAGFLLLGASLLLSTPASAASVTNVSPIDSTTQETMVEETYETDSLDDETYESDILNSVDTNATVKSVTKTDSTESTESTDTSSTAMKLSSAVKFKATLNRTTQSRKVLAKKKSAKNVKATAKTKSTKAIKKSITKSITVNGTKITLGMSKSEVTTMMNKIYGSPAYTGKGCQSYDSDCIYYQQNGNETSYMFEFYNGSLERVVFSSPDWTMGKMTSKTKASSINVSSKTYRASSGNVYAKYFTASKGNVSFTAYRDLKAADGWYLCDFTDTGVKHSGKNSLADQTQTLSFDLTKFNVSTLFQKSHKSITLDKVIKACSEMNCLDLEKGKQNVYFTNMYRAYHGLELAVYSETTSEYAYVNAKVRSMAKEDFHADFFDGDFADRARKNTIREERINEWLDWWSESYSENVGYESGANAITVLQGTVASKGHQENALRGNFAIGAAVVDGYDTVEFLSTSHMDEEDIAEAQESFVKEYDVGISAKEVEAALYRDTYSVYTYDNLYQLTTMSKSEWIDFVLNKYNLTNVNGAKEYVDNRYDHYIKVAKNDTYKGKTSFYNSYEAWLTAGDLTESQLQDIYIYFCRQEYNQDDCSKAYLQALMKYFNCTEEDVYLEHFDILSTLSTICRDDNGTIADKVKVISSDYNIPSDVAGEMCVRAHTGWNDTIANKVRADLGLEPVYSN